MASFSAIVRAVNVWANEWDETEDWSGGGARERRLLGRDVFLGATVYVLDPGRWVIYHAHHGSDELVLVLEGSPTLRTPAGERELGPWDCAFFPSGEEGAHKVTNRTDEPVRVCIWSNRIAVATSIYPDSEKVGAWPPNKLFRLADAVDYFEGEV